MVYTLKRLVTLTTGYTIGVDLPGAVGANAPIGKGSVPVGACTHRKIDVFIIYRVFFCNLSMSGFIKLIHSLISFMSFSEI